MAAAVATWDGLPPGLRFDPKDDELVARYLLARIRARRPGGFLRITAGARSDEAFLFAEARAKNGKGSRQKRTVVGGGY
ncbi:hypothetical protein E2562_035808 [Oryza meyeriana var. granulata]|uniref:NAC domain-containing protein n=1 Tax=Oryza meyeriana var. granulata TaxID=110450 RepID=A0A6G1DAA6_9ORYZ|nr:hypothetical protein E2562_035808 [Oryza meyeriana var. granulata]